MQNTIKEFLDLGMQPYANNKFFR